jgi:hypothetical protein
MIFLAFFTSCFILLTFTASDRCTRRLPRTTYTQTCTDTT